MATATEISRKALRRLNVVAAGESPPADDVQAAIDALNAMVASWEASGVIVTLPMDDRFEQATVAMLAVRLSEDYGATVGPVLVRDAENGWITIQAHYITPAEPTFDYALTRTPSRRFPYTTPIDGTRPWKANTSWGLASLVTNAGNVYVCIVAGVSGTTGPSGTDNNQTDGTCVWDYVQAIGG